MNRRRPYVLVQRCERMSIYEWFKERQRETKDKFDRGDQIMQVANSTCVNNELLQEGVDKLGQGVSSQKLRALCFHMYIQCLYFNDLKFLVVKFMLLFIALYLNNQIHLFFELSSCYHLFFFLQSSISYIFFFWTALYNLFLVPTRAYTLEVTGTQESLFFLKRTLILVD